MHNKYIDNDAALAHIQPLSSLLASLDEEDVLIDRAVEMHLFAFMRKTIVQNERFVKEVSSHTNTHTYKYMHIHKANSALIFYICIYM